MVMQKYPHAVPDVTGGRGVTASGERAGIVRIGSDPYSPYTPYAPQQPKPYTAPIVGAPYVAPIIAPDMVPLTRIVAALERLCVALEVVAKYATERTPNMAGPRD